MMNLPNNSTLERIEGTRKSEFTGSGSDFDATQPLCLLRL